MGHADGLSRLPIEDTEDEPEDIAEHPALCRSLRETLKLQDLPQIKELIHKIRASEKTPDELKHFDKGPDKGRPHWYIQDELIWIESRVYLKREDAKKVFKWLHEHPAVGGHMGLRKLLHIYREGYITDHDYALGQEVIQTCLTCQAQKDYGNTPKVPAHPLQPKHPFHIISLDFAGPYQRTARQAQYILVLVDLFTRYMIAIPTRDQKAETVASILVTRVFTVFQLPDVILTDQGPQFEGTLMASLCQQFGAVKKRTTAYHPQTNGCNERSHRTILNYLRCCVGNEKRGT